MRYKIYNALVNRHIGIKERYHRVHDNTHGAGKIFSWLYLLWLNLCFYVFFCRRLGEKSGFEMYEKKKLVTRRSESEAGECLKLNGRELCGFGEELIEKVVKKLSEYDIISFDIFDTLIFRPFSEPTDLFYFIGERLGYLDFKRIRTKMELKARQEAYMREKTYEICLRDIWKLLNDEAGISDDEGMAEELAAEKNFCYANPFMLEVYSRLKDMGKRIFIVSDMYLPGDFLENLLRGQGYDGFEKLYVSCEHKKSKADGSLYELVKKEISAGTKKCIHVGDNVHSDVSMAGRHGFDTLWYPNVNKNTLLYRPYDMSYAIGGAYRGIVNNHLYCKNAVYSIDYEYGYIYGGLFVVGYCHFIHDYCKSHGIEKILFLSRDGDILKKVYDEMYPEDSTEYAYWSRRAATKLSACFNRYDFFRRFLYHKVNQNISLQNILESMELEQLSGMLREEGLKEAEYLTDKNVDEVKNFLKRHWDEVIDIYGKEHEGAKAYYSELLGNSKSAAAVDIGWAGSGAAALDYLVGKVWKLGCSVTGIIAGTNTIYNAEPDASEAQLMSGRIVSYLFSQAHNRDLLKKHDSNMKYNVYWELLLSSPTRQFKGFSYEKEDELPIFMFGDLDYNQEGICEIQKGILDFAEEYMQHFGEYDYMFNISGRDAYAPMLVAAGHDERYLKMIEKRFRLDISVG